MQVQSPSGSGVSWGVYTSGCNPPVFSISVNWKKNDALQCSEPYIYVTSITEDSGFVCSMQFTTNQLRSFPSTTQALQSLQSDVYALGGSVGGSILNSPSHVQNIMGCIFRANPGLLCVFA